MSKKRPEKNIKLNFVSRLQKQCKAWQKLAAPSLRHRQLMLNSWASGFYSEDSHKARPVNLMDRGVSTVVPFLVEGNPKVMVETPISNYRSWAYTTELALNFFIDKMELAENVLIPCAINSMFGAGITKTTLVHDKNMAIEGEIYKLGTPEIQVIDDSNYIGDASVKFRKDMLIEGDVYRLPTEYAKDFFGSKFADDITSDGSLYEDYSPEAISSSHANRELLGIRDYTTFIDIYLKDEGVTITIRPEGNNPRIYKTVEWEGPPGGPYDYLHYKNFPSSPISLPPAWSWFDVDLTVEVLIEKMRMQAENQKDVLAYQGGAEEDVSRITKTGNMGTVKVDNLDLMKTLSFGGANPLNYQYVEYMESQFTKSGTPSSDVLAGRGSQSPTLGQEQMVMSNAMRIIYNMLSRFDRFSTSVLKKLAWGFWVDPTAYVPIVKEIPGVGQLPEIFSDSGKVGDFYDFAFRIKPYSTQRTSPDIKFSKMINFLDQWIIPTMGGAAQQGSTLDFDVIGNTLANYLGIDNFNQWYRTAVPHELNSVDYKMSPQQGNQTSLSARTANNQQQQARSGGQPSPAQKGERRL